MMPGLDASSMGMMPSGMGDLSKLPMELLAALSAGGGAGLDPAMLSALKNSRRWRPVELKHVYKNGNTLRNYQIEGISWLAFF